MEYPKLIVSKQKEESISIQKVKYGRNIYWDKLNELVYQILVLNSLVRSKDSAEPGHIVIRESKPCIIDFHIFQERQKT